MLEALLGVVLLAAPEESPRYELRWAAPSECPGVEQVRGRIDELIAYAPEGASEAIAVAVEIVAAEPGFVASLQLRSGEDEGRRELGDPDCRELADAVALIVALAIDPELLSREPEPGDEALGESPDEPVEPPDEPVESPDEPVAPDTAEEPEPAELPDGADEVATKPGTRVGFGLVLRGGGGFAVVAPASGRLALAASSFGRRWRVELGGSLWLPQRVDIGRFSIAAAELRGCFVPEQRNLEFPICAGVEAGAMIGVGSVAGGRRASAAWLAASPGVGLSWVGLDDRLALGLRVDAVLPLVRPAFASDGGRLLVRAGFGAQALAGVELRFGARRDRVR